MTGPETSHQTSAKYGADQLESCAGIEPSRSLKIPQYFIVIIPLFSLHFYVAKYWFTVCISGISSLQSVILVIP